MRTPFNEGDGTFSPDGRWVAYSSQESGRDEVYVRRFSPSAPSAPSGKWLVSNGGGVSPHWRRDGKELFYLAPDLTVMAVSVTAGASFQVGTPTPLFKISASGLTGGYFSVSADGTRFLVEVPERQDLRPPFTVVVNWQAGLKK